MSVPISQFIPPPTPFPPCLYFCFASKVFFRDTFDKPPPVGMEELRTCFLAPHSWRADLWVRGDGCTSSDAQQELSGYFLASFIYSVNYPFSREMADTSLKHLDEVRTSVSNALFGCWMQFNCMFFENNYHVPKMGLDTVGMQNRQYTILASTLEEYLI